MCLEMLSLNENRSIDDYLTFEKTCRCEENKTNYLKIYFRVFSFFLFFPSLWRVQKERHKWIRFLLCLKFQVRNMLVPLASFWDSFSCCSFFFRSYKWRTFSWQSTHITFGKKWWYSDLFFTLLFSFDDGLFNRINFGFESEGFLFVSCFISDTQFFKEFVQSCLLLFFLFPSS